MIKNIIQKYRNLSFEAKTIFMTKYSIWSNGFLVFFKWIIAIFLKNVFFFVAGVVNLFILISKLECYLGITQPQKKSFQYRNRMIGCFLILSGLQYAIYMGRLIYSNIRPMNYGLFLAIAIAFVSFIEMGSAIYGCFKSYGKGHYYRNIKLINLCSALTAMVLTEVAITSFSTKMDTSQISGFFGIGIALIMIFIAIFIFVAPKISIVDKEHNIYQKISNQSFIQTKEVFIQLTFSKLYGNYFYKAILDKNIIDGHIIKGKNPVLFWNKFLLVILIILSEILIFPYAIGAFIFYFKNAKLIQKLDQKMLELGYHKINSKEA